MLCLFIYFILDLSSPDIEKIDKHDNQKHAWRAWFHFYIPDIKSRNSSFNLICVTNSDESKCTNARLSLDIDPTKNLLKINSSNCQLNANLPDTSNYIKLHMEQYYRTDHEFRLLVNLNNRETWKLCNLNQDDPPEDIVIYKSAGNFVIRDFLWTQEPVGKNLLL